MLRLNKYFYFLLFIMFSCNKKQEKNEDLIINNTLLKEISMRIAGEVEYNIVYNLAMDSLNTWVENQLSITKALQHSNWQLDSLLCFNRDVSKVIMAIYHQESATTNNAIDYFYGVKIKNKWYFFKGPVLFANPSYHEKLTFPQLHAIAMKEVFRGYLKKNAHGPSHGGEWEINEKFFSDIDRVLSIHKGKFETEKEWEEWWVKTTTEVNWSKRESIVK
jgi:hypothetical protein